MIFLPLIGGSWDIFVIHGDRTLWAHIHPSFARDTPVTLHLAIRTFMDLQEDISWKYFRAKEKLLITRAWLRYMYTHDIILIECLHLLTLSQISPGFLHVCSTSLLKTLWEMCFLPIWRTFYHLHEIWRTFYHFHQIQNVVCKLFQFGRI